MAKFLIEARAYQLPAGYLAEYDVSKYAASLLADMFMAAKKYSRLPAYKSAENLAPYFVVSKNNIPLLRTDAGEIGILEAKLANLGNQIGALKQKINTAQLLHYEVNVLNYIANSNSNFATYAKNGAEINTGGGGQGLLSYRFR